MAPLRSLLARNALGVLLACMLSSTTVGCHSWEPVSPAGLQARLRESGDQYVQVKSGDQSLVVSRATACQLGDAYVLSGISSQPVEALVDAGLLKTLATGCECQHPPCTHLDVTHADVLVRKSDPGKSASMVLGLGIFGGLVVGMLVLLFLAGLHGMSGG